MRFLNLKYLYTNLLEDESSTREIVFLSDYNESENTVEIWDQIDSVNVVIIDDISGLEICTTEQERQYVLDYARKLGVWEDKGENNMLKFINDLGAEREVTEDQLRDETREMIDWELEKGYTLTELDERHIAESIAGISRGHNHLMSNRAIEIVRDELENVGKADAKSKETKVKKLSFQMWYDVFKNISEINNDDGCESVYGDEWVTPIYLDPTTDECSKWGLAYDEELFEHGFKTEAEAIARLDYIEDKMLNDYAVPFRTY